MLKNPLKKLYLFKPLGSGYLVCGISLRKAAIRHLCPEKLLISELPGKTDIFLRVEILKRSDSMLKFPTRQRPLHVDSSVFSWNRLWLVGVVK